MIELQPELNVSKKLSPLFRVRIPITRAIKMMTINVSMIYEY
jgi:hypothetical protein